MRNYVIINGVNSNTITGLAINELPPISKPPLRTLIEEIDGRDGDLITELGYGAYDKVMTIGLYHTFDIDQIIAFFNGTGTIVFSNEPDKKYNFKIIEQIDYESLIKFRTASITLHCQPFKYPLSETPIEAEYKYITETGTNITLNNTKQAKMTIDLKGNTSQASTTGQNLFNYKDQYDVNQLYTIDDDGWISASYNNTGSSTVFLNYITHNLNLQTSTSYITMLEVKSVSGTGSIYIATTHSTSQSGSNIYRQFDDISSNNVYKNNITTISDFTNATAGIRSYLRFGAGQSGSITFRLSVLANTSITPETFKYEPYTNGPAPNPDFPMDIHVVSGDNKIEVEGKNLFDKDNAPTIKLYVDTTNNVLKTSENSYATYLEIQPNTTYTISKQAGQAFRVATSIQKPANNVSILSTTANHTGTSITITTEANAKYLYINYFNSGNTGTADEMKATIQLEKGSTATTYTPYVSQTQLISLGVENLFDKDNANILSAYINTTSHAIYSSDTNKVAYIQIKGGTTYTISKTTSDRFQIATTSSLPANNVSTIQEISDNSATTITITTDNTAKYLVVHYWRSSDTKTEQQILDTIQIEKGSKKNSYTPYGTTPIELCKIGTYQDYIYKEDDKWYLHKEIKKAILGTDITFSSTTGGYYSASVNDYAVSGNTPYCYWYKGVSNIGTISGINDKQIAFNTSTSPYPRLYLKDSDYSSATTLNNDLSSNNVAIYYVLATPTDTEITDTTLINQLNTILYSYNGQTNVSQSNNDEAFIMTITAETLGSGEAIINNVGNFYSKPTIDIEGNGTVNVSLNNNQIFSVNVTDEVIINSTNLEAYKPDGTLQNRQVTGNIANLKLNTGNNTMTFSGDLTKATITDYTRYL